MGLIPAAEYIFLYHSITCVGPYLILATEKRCVGSIDAHMVYEVAGTELVSFSKTNIHLSESQVHNGFQSNIVFSALLASDKIFYHNCHSKACL